eukprot:jgi/Chlat1/3892/Chrsp26S04176
MAAVVGAKLNEEGSKSVEGRCAAPPYRSLASGDQLLVSNSLMLHIQVLYTASADDEAAEVSLGVAAIHVAPAEFSEQTFCIVDTLLQLGFLWPA